MTTACICSAGQLALPSDPPGLETVTVTGRWFAALPVRTLNSQWNTGGVETEKGEIMVVTGVVVATTVLLGVAVWLHMVGRRTRFVLVLSAATLLALAGCTSEGDNTASVVSSDPSASEPLSTADAADSAVESPTDPAMSSPNGSSPASESDGSATYPPDQAQLCQARDDLRTSLDELTDPGLLTQGATAIGAAVDQAQNDLDAVVTAGRPELQPQLDALQSSLDELRTAVGSLGDGGVAESLQAVGTAAAGVGSSSTDLLSELNEICGA